MTHRNPWPILLIALVTLMTLGPLVACDFTWWDDNETLHHNPLMNPPTRSTLSYYWTHPYMGLYVPVTYTLWTGLAALAHVDTPDDRGITLNPYLFHAANLALHLLNTFLIYALLRRILKRDWHPVIGALLFAIHPVQVETVAWVSGLKDLLFTTLVLSTLVTYLKGASSPSSRERLAHVLLSFLFTILATLSKPTAVVTPLLILTLDRLVLHKSWRTSLRSVLPFFLAVLPCLIWAKLVQSVGSKSPLPARPFLALDALTFYLGKLLWPAHLAVDYGHTPTHVLSQPLWYLSCIPPLLVAVLLFYYRERHPTLLAAACIFVAALGPVLGFVSFMFQGYSTTADHYLYLPMLGLALAAAYAATLVPPRPTAVVSSILLLACAARSLAQTRVWRDDQSLDLNTLAVNPRSDIAHMNLATLLEFRARAEHSPALQQQALDHLRESLRLKPDNPRALHNLSVILIQRGQIDAAIQTLLDAIAIADNVPPEEREPLGPSYRALATILSARGRHAEAARMLRKSLEYDPANQEAVAALPIEERRARTPATSAPATTRPLPPTSEP